MSAQAILYAAKSTEDVHGSIPAQLKDGRQLAEQEGLEVVGEYSDEAASAYKGDRGPELAAALEHAERVGATLIVQHSDRLARGDGIQARHLGELFFAASKTGMTLRSVQDDSTFQNPVLAVVMGERNMEDSRRKSLAVKAGMERRRKRGLYNGGFAPYGYLHRRNEDDERVLVIDEEQAPWVRRIFDLYLVGETYVGIAQKLEAEGVPGPKGTTLWPHFTIRKILMNPVYTGLIRGGGELIEGVHEAIIDRETWAKTAALLKAKARTYKRGRPSAGQHLFRKGFLKCGICGEDMGPLTYRERPHPTDQIYRCQGRKRHAHTCDMSAVYRSDVDGAVYAYFKDLGLDVEATREQLVAARELELAKARDVLQSAEEETQIARGHLERVKRDYISEELTAAEWRELREELEPELCDAQAEEERLREQLEEAESESALSKITVELLAQLSDIRAEIAKEVTDRKEAAAVRAALMRLFDGFVLHRGSPRHETREGNKVAYWLEPVLSQHQMGGYVDRLRTKLRTTGSGFPLGKAKNNSDRGVREDACGLSVRLRPTWLQGFMRKGPWVGQAHAILNIAHCHRNSAGAAGPLCPRNRPHLDWVGAVDPAAPRCGQDNARLARVNQNPVRWLRGSCRW
jgi:site-specific DNA recombinase